MSDKEIQHLAVLKDVRDQRIIQVRAAEILNLSTRQITRLLQKLKQDGVSGLTHASRGQPGHRRHDDLLKSKCLSIISEHLLGFGPTLAHEKLSSMFDLNIPVETLRRWVTANDLWIPRSKRLNPTINSRVINIHTTFGQHFLQFTIANAIFTILAHSPKNDFALKKGFICCTFSYKRIQLTISGYLQQCHLKSTS